MAEKNVVTAKHHLGIGQIIVQWARLERSMIPATQSLLGTSVADTVLMLWHMDYNNKRDRIANLIDVREPDEQFKKEFKTLFDRLDSAAQLRNHIAHSVWKKGESRNTITSVTIRARGAIKISGKDFRQEHFTPSRLSGEAQKLERLVEDFRQFFRTHFSAAFTPEERDRASKKKRN
jgi:hypothetical protein